MGACASDGCSLFLSLVPCKNRRHQNSPSSKQAYPHSCANSVCMVCQRLPLSARIAHPAPYRSLLCRQPGRNVVVRYTSIMHISTYTRLAMSHCQHHHQCVAHAALDLYQSSHTIQLPPSPLLQGTPVLSVPPAWLHNFAALMAAVETHRVTHVTAVPALWARWLPFFSPHGE